MFSNAPVAVRYNRLIIGLILLISAYLAYVVLFRDKSQSSSLSPAMLAIVHFVVMFIVGINVVMAVNRLWGKPLLEITDEGFSDNAPYRGMGFVPWSDVKEITDGKVGFQRAIVVILKNPEEYVNRQQKPLAKRLLAANYNRFLTPAVIYIRNMNMGADEIKKVMEERMVMCHKATTEG